MKENGSANWSRRDVLKTMTAGGAGAAVLGRALTVLAEGGQQITMDMIRQAEWISGLSSTEVSCRRHRFHLDHGSRRRVR